MTTRAIDSDGDWMFGNGILDYKDGIEEIKQNIITTLKSWKNDCFFDMDAGVDWINYLGSFGKEEEIKRDIIYNVCKVKGVINVISYDSYLENRNIVITIKVNTYLGNLEIKEEF